MAVPIGYSAAAGALLIRWHRIDEKTEERIVPDHGVERILFRLDQDLHPVGFQGRMTAENPFRKAVCIVCDHLHAPVVGFEGRDVILPRTDCSEYHLGRIVGMDHLRIDPDVVLNFHQIVAGIAQGCEGTDKFDALRCIQAEDEERGAGAGPDSFHLAEVLYGQIEQVVLFYLDFYPTMKDEFEYACNLVYFMTNEISKAGDESFAVELSKKFSSFLNDNTSIAAQ